jgi:GTP cyclohydrolase II
MDFKEEGINGPHSALTTERAVEELRRGRAIQLFDGSRWFLVAAVETMGLPLLERLRRIDGVEMQLLLTPQRAQAAGLVRERAGPVEIRVPRDTTLDVLRTLAGFAPWDSAHRPRIKSTRAQNAAGVEAGFRLAKLARLLPALLMLQTEEIDDPSLSKIRIDDLMPQVRLACPSLELISRARVPLLDALTCEIVLFRQRGESREHLAILIGTPDARDAVPVRLHSACLTGDVLGSLRCDCGDQLKRAVSRIGSLGGGVLLYLDQEGRGIGLANKLRAYALQDTGLDTVDADQHLGFLSDERDYAIAATVLRELGFERIRLLTNNPAKISALAQHGIEVVGRLPLVATVNAYNQRYLKAKLDRAGHLAE